MRPSSLKIIRPVSVWIGLLILAGLAQSATARELKLTILDTDSLQPVEKASVIGTLGSRQIPAVSDSKGECVLKLPDGPVVSRLHVKSSLRGYIPSIMEWKMTGQTEPEIPEEYTIYLERGGPVGGKVTDEAGEPVADVEIHIFARMERGERERTEAWDKTVLTNDEGVWKYENLPSEIKKIRLRLKHEDYITNAYFDYGAGGSRSIADLFAQTDVIQLVQSLTINGLVQDSKNKPVEGAKLTMGIAQGWPGNATGTKSNATGEFKFRDAQVGESVFAVQAEGFAPDVVRQAIDKEHKKIIFTLFPGHLFRAKVVSDTDAPVEGAEVTLVEWRDGVVPDFRAKTDEAGRIEWKGAPGSEFKVKVVAEGYAPLRAHAVQVSKEEVIIPLKGLLKFFGSVVDEETGAKVESFSVTDGFDFDRGNGTTSISWQGHTRREFVGGTFDFVPQEIYTTNEKGERVACEHAIRIEAEGYLPSVTETFSEEDGPQNLEIKLKKGKSMIGFVRSSDGKPVEGAEAALALPGQYLMIHNGKLQEGLVTPTAKSNAEGKLVFSPQIDPGIIVVLHDSGWAQVSSELLAEGPADITLKPWARLEGRLLREGEPLGGRDISLGFSDPEMMYYNGKTAHVAWYGSMKSDSKGEFSDNRVREGDWIVSHQVQITRTNSRMGGNYQEGGTIWNARAEAKPGETVKIVLDEPQVRQVSGKFRVPPGSPESTLDLLRPNIQTWRAPAPSQFKKRTKEERIAWMKSPEGREEMKNQMLMRSVPVEVLSDGRFTAKEVPVGEYVLHASMEKLNTQGNTTSYEQVLQHRFSVKAAEGDEMNTGVDLGELDLTISRPLLPGDPIPSVDLVGLDGGKFNLTDYKGKNLVLIIWYPMGDESEESRQRMKELSALNEVWSARQKDSKFAMLGIVPYIQPEAAREILGDTELKWPQSTFATPVAGNSKLGSPGMFAVILFNADGRCVKAGTPMKDAPAEIEGAFPSGAKK